MMFTPRRLLLLLLPLLFVLSSAQGQDGTTSTTPPQESAQEKPAPQPGSHQDGAAPQSESGQDVGQGGQSECKNAHQNDSDCEGWKGMGECARNEDWMRLNCQKSCGFCGPGQDEAQCRNVHENVSDCDAWKGTGECERNEAWMRENCKKTCGFCGQERGGVTPQPTLVSNECRNAHQNDSECENWKKIGECERNEPWMRKNCEKGCQFCGSEVAITPQPPLVSNECQNGHENDVDCDNWASTGECTNNEDWMRINCAKSCGHCSPPGGTTRAIDDLTPVTSRSTTTTEPPVCEDLVVDCRPLVEDGMCGGRDDWMTRNCRLSCRYCEPPSTTTTTTTQRPTPSPPSPLKTTAVPVPPVDGVAATTKPPPSSSDATEPVTPAETRSGASTLRHSLAFTVIALIATMTSLCL